MVYTMSETKVICTIAKQVQVGVANIEIQHTDFTKGINVIYYTYIRVYSAVIWSSGGEYLKL